MACLLKRSLDLSAPGGSRYRGLWQGFNPNFFEKLHIQSTYCNVDFLQLVKNIDKHFSKSGISNKQQFNISQFNRIDKQT
jgi:hypothetical protein